MLIVVVQVRVKPEAVEAFQAATRENARQSRLEPGIARFDVLQQSDDSTRFVLIEAYRHLSAPVAHKETAHYRAWREAVEGMMAEPRQSTKYGNISPDDDTW
jgi:autoinducer 2-degrading protein